MLFDRLIHIASHGVAPADPFQTAEIQLRRATKEANKVNSFFDTNGKAHLRQGADVKLKKLRFWVTCVTSIMDSRLRPHSPGRVDVAAGVLARSDTCANNSNI